jgi:hypothetical protein
VNQGAGKAAIGDKHSQNEPSTMSPSTCNHPSPSWVLKSSAFETFHTLLGFGKTLPLPSITWICDLSTANGSFQTLPVLSTTLISRPRSPRRTRPLPSTTRISFSKDPRKTRPLPSTTWISLPNSPRSLRALPWTIWMADLSIESLTWRSFSLARMRKLDATAMRVRVSSAA